MVRVMMVAVGLVLAAAAQAQSDGDWAKVVAAAKQEGKVVVYTATVGSVPHKEVWQAFEKTYGVRVELLEARASEVRERIRIEQAAGRFLGDIHHNGMTTTWLMQQEGAFQPHGGIPNAGNIIPPYDADDIRLPSDVGSYALLINKNLVKPADEPKSWKDLLEPKWTGKILADDMRALGGGAVFFVVMHQAFGREYHEKLAGQKLVYSRDLRNNERRVARGEFPIYLPFGITALPPLKGLPLKVVVPAEGRPYIRFDLTVLKNAPHPNAARLFINHMLAAESQLVFANAGFDPVVKGVVERASEEMRPYLATKAMGTTDPPRQNEMLELATQIYK